jgi:hypothetical protein
MQNLGNGIQHKLRILRTLGLVRRKGLRSRNVGVSVSAGRQNWGFPMGVSLATASAAVREPGKTLGCFGNRGKGQGKAGFGQLEDSMSQRRLLRKAE